MSKTDRLLYKVGLLGLFIIVAAWMLVRVTGFDLSVLRFSCMFNQVTGLYCPGCGGTRAVLALQSGRIGRSLHYHPLVLYAVGIFGIYMLSNTIQWISKDKWKTGLHYRDIYLWIALALLGQHFVIKNLMLLVWNIRL